MEQDKKYPVELDFDRWMQLAVADPQAFEDERQALIDEFIEHSFADERRARLRCLQWRIDVARRRAPTPIAACVSLNEMMWDSFAGDCGLADTLRNATCFNPELLKRAKVITLHSPRS